MTPHIDSAAKTDLWRVLGFSCAFVALTATVLCRSRRRWCTVLCCALRKTTEIVIAPSRLPPWCLLINVSVTNQRSAQRGVIEAVSQRKRGPWDEQWEGTHGNALGLRVKEICCIVQICRSQARISGISTCVNAVRALKPRVLPTRIERVLYGCCLRTAGTMYRMRYQRYTSKSIQDGTGPSSLISRLPAMSAVLLKGGHVDEAPCLLR